MKPTDRSARQTDALLHIHTEEIQTDGKDTFHFHRYEPTPYPVLHALFSELQLKPEDTLLDYGSGLGRLCFYANHHFHCQAIGVEFSEKLHRTGMQNLSSYRGAHKDRISFVHARAEEYIVPETVNVIYCFNPFSTKIFRRVLTNIALSHEKKKRDILLILYYPEYNTILHIERHTSFRLWRELPVGDAFANDRRERFVIFRLSG